MSNPENLDAYIQYRVEKSREVFEAAELLANANMWNSTINRLYYSCFHAASALLLNKNIEVRRHTGVLSQFSENFVWTGMVSMEDFRTYSKLMNWRSKSDYRDMHDFEEEDVLPLLDKTRKFITIVISLISFD